MNKEDIKKKREDYLARKKEKALQNEPPEIERVSDFEVYLLKEEFDAEKNVKTKVRLKRICGHKKRGLPDEYVCLSHAGAGTNHQGVGYCVVHDPKNAIDEKYWRKLNSALNVPVTIQDLYERTTELSKTDTFNLTNIMKRTMVLYWDILQHPESIDPHTGEPILSLKQRTELRLLDKQAMEIIECERRSVGEGKLKGATISHFLQSIFDVITNSLPKNQGQMIMNRIVNITYTQHDEGKIQGDMEGIEKKVVSFEMKYQEQEEQREENKAKEIIGEVEVVDE